MRAPMRGLLACALFLSASALSPKRELARSVQIGDVEVTGENRPGVLKDLVIWYVREVIKASDEYQEAVDSIAEQVLDAAELAIDTAVVLVQNTTRDEIQPELEEAIKGFSVLELIFGEISDSAEEAWQDKLDEWAEKIQDAIDNNPATAAIKELKEAIWDARAEATGGVEEQLENSTTLLAFFQAGTVAREGVFKQLASDARAEFKAQYITPIKDEIDLQVDYLVGNLTSSLFGFLWERGLTGPQIIEAVNARTQPWKDDFAETAVSLAGKLAARVVQLLERAYERLEQRIDPPAED